MLGSSGRGIPVHDQGVIGCDEGELGAKEVKLVRDGARRDSRRAVGSTEASVLVSAVFLNNI